MLAGSRVAVALSRTYPDAGRGRCIAAAPGFVFRRMVECPGTTCPAGCVEKPCAAGNLGWAWRQCGVPGPGDAQLAVVGDVGRPCGQADYPWLIPGVAVYFMGVWARSWRWHYLLRPIKVVPVGQLFPVMAIGYIGNNIFPIRAGELLRIYLLKMSSRSRCRPGWPRSWSNAPSTGS